ncbi:MAG: hypothetical protein EOO41_02445, partial [Methanobacteriota archaeon]
FAAIPALQTSGAAFTEWIGKGITPVYDPRNVPASQKQGVVFGMSMTEKTGGSDVRSNTTRAAPLSGRDAAQAGGAYSLIGHKWFTSAPMCDAFLTLAYSTPRAGEHAAAEAGAPTSDGLSCFLVPRWLSDGQRNTGFRVVRLKDKLGDRSNASSEVEYDNAVGYLVGPPGRGVPTILEMVVHTRLDCALGSAGLMRQAVRAALHYTSQRRAFGAVLTDQPAMRAVLADLLVESGAAMVLSLGCARLFDDCARQGSDGNTKLHPFRRLAVALAKYYICKRSPGVVTEASECIGGNGYVEEWDFPRWARQAPLNAIWEGSGNVIALDILRTLQKEPLALTALLEEVATTASAHPRQAAAVASVHAALKHSQEAIANPAFARFFVEQLSQLLIGHWLAVMCASSTLGVEEREWAQLVHAAWCASRLPSVTSVQGAASVFAATSGSLYGSWSPDTVADVVRRSARSVANAREPLAHLIDLELAAGRRNAEQ